MDSRKHSLNRITPQRGAIESVTGLNLPQPTSTANLSESGRQVSRTLRALLGTQVRGDDPNGLLKALQNSFSPFERDGRKVLVWGPRASGGGYDASGLKGAQPLLFVRARERLEKAQAMLNVIRPLNCDSDCGKNVENLRSVIRELIVDLSDQFMSHTGPNPTRVNLIFITLFGSSKSSEIVLEDLDGELGELQHGLGMDFEHSHTPSGTFPPGALLAGDALAASSAAEADDFGPVQRAARILNLADSANYTNFIALADDLRSVFATWETFSVYFDLNAVGRAPLQVQLAVLGEYLQRIHRTLTDFLNDCDDAGFDEPDQAATQLRTNRDNLSMNVSELMEWIRHISGEGGERLLENAGFSAIQALRTALEKQQLLLGELELLAGSKRGGKHINLSDEECLYGGIGLQDDRVRQGLKDLVCHIDDTLDILNAVQPLPQQIKSNGSRVQEQNVTKPAALDAGKQIIHNPPAPTGGAGLTDQVNDDMVSAWLLFIERNREATAFLNSIPNDPTVREAIRLFNEGVRILAADEYEIVFTGVQLYHVPTQQMVDCSRLQRTDPALGTGKAKEERPASPEDSGESQGKV